jgi:hypothetical protein
LECDRFAATKDFAVGLPRFPQNLPPLELYQDGYKSPAVLALFDCAAKPSHLPGDARFERVKGLC